MAASKGIVATLLLLVLLLLGAGLAFVVVDSANNGGPNTLGLDTTQYWVVAGILGVSILVIFIAMIIVLTRRTGAPRAAATDVEFEMVDAIATARRIAQQAPSVSAKPDQTPPGYGLGPKVVVYDLPSVQEAYRSWSGSNGGMTYTYPREVATAIYSNDHLDVGGGKHLKVRTLLAGPEDTGPLPEEQAAPAPVNVTADELPEPYRSKLSKAPRRARIEPAGEGDAFVAQLDEARKAPKAKPRAGPTYYGYSGDVHPVEDIEGIGAIYGEKLRNAGVYTTDRLCYEKTETLADKVGVPRKTVETWKAMSELVKVKGVGPQYAEAMARAGINGIADLKRRRPAGLAEQVQAYLDSLNATVIGTPITEKRVEGWQKNAARMKRVKLQVPEK